MIHLLMKQGFVNWNLRFDEGIKGFGFVQTYWESCIYKKVSGSYVAFLILYLDDILLIWNDIDLINSVKSYLNCRFFMKYVGEASYLSGIKFCGASGNWGTMAYMLLGSEGWPWSTEDYLGETSRAETLRLKPPRGKEHLEHDLTRPRSIGSC